MKVYVLLYTGGNAYNVGVFSSVDRAIAHANSLSTVVSTWNVYEHGADTGAWQIDAFELDSGGDEIGRAHV